MKFIYLILFISFGISALNAQTASLGGQIFLNSDSVTVLSSVTVILSDATGNILNTTVTDEFGRYEFNDLTTEQIYQVEPVRTGDNLNGVSTFDMVLIQQHILGRNEFANPLQFFAGDLNNSQTVTTLDMVQMRQLILGITNQLPNGRDSWLFVQSTAIPITPDNPFANIMTDNFTVDLTEDVADFNFIGVKVGDVNGSAAP